MKPSHWTCETAPINHRSRIHLWFVKLGQTPEGYHNQGKGEVPEESNLERPADHIINDLWRLCWSQFSHILGNVRYCEEKVAESETRSACFQDEHQWREHRSTGSNAAGGQMLMQKKEEDKNKRDRSQMPSILWSQIDFLSSNYTLHPPVLSVHH